MTGMRLNGWTMAAMVAVMAANVAAQGTGSAAAAPAGQTRIVVSLEDRKLALVEDGKVVKVYPVAVGKPSTPSPVGTFKIARRVVNPTYSHDGRVVPPGPQNPVGSRWMGLSISGFGIHGTNVPSSIGKAASHGCIRMAKADLEELYPQVTVGETVEIIGQRNEETAQLFGGGAPSAVPAQEPAQLAKADPAGAAPAQSTSNTTQAQAAESRSGSALVSSIAVAGAL